MQCVSEETQRTKGYKAGQYQETSHYNKEMLFHTQEIGRMLGYEDEQTGNCMLLMKLQRETSVLNISWLCFISGTEDGRSKTSDHTVKVAWGRTRASTSPEGGKSTTCLSDVQNSRHIQKTLVKRKANYRRDCMDNLYKISHMKKTLFSLWTGILSIKMWMGGIHTDFKIVGNVGGSWQTR